MAQETNQTPVPMLCAMGCGFYGNPRTNGMCSVCYKEHLQRQQGGGRSSPPSEKGAAAATSPAGSPVGAAVVSVESSSTSEPSAEVDTHLQDRTPSPGSPTPMTQQMTEMTLSQDSGPNTDSDHAEGEEDEDEGSSSKHAGPGVCESGQVCSDGDQTPDKNKKKKRCFTCRKKVGLTGFDCRCGNLFCGVHRYSDKHACPFDYRAAAAARLRKDNPAVVAEKIQKL